MKLSRLLALTALGASLTACGATPSPLPRPTAEAPPAPAAGCPEPGRRLIVTGQPEAVVAAFGEIVLSIPELDAVVVCVADNADAMSIYSAMDGVEEDRVLTIPEGESVPDEIGIQLEPIIAPFTEPQESGQWAISAIGLLAAHGRTLGTDVLVAVIDSGADCSHEDYVCAGDIDLIGSGARHLHATHVAGIVAALRNQIGVLGTAPAARILSVRVLDTSGAGNTSTIAQGIVKATDAGAKVLNLSLGGPGTNSTMASAVKYATDRGVVVIAAAGNSNSGSPFSPACEAGVLAIGATDQNGQKASFSNFGTCVRIAAPGVSILSTLPGNKYGNLSGTSMASPIVAGVAALLVSLGQTDVVNTLINTGRPGPSNLGGKLLAADLAVNVVPGPTIEPPPFPTTRPTSPVIVTPPVSATSAPAACTKTITPLLRSGDGGVWTPITIVVPCP